MVCHEQREKSDAHLLSYNLLSVRETAVAFLTERTELVSLLEGGFLQPHTNTHIHNNDNSFPTRILIYTSFYDHAD